jgi:hypothetical protein
MHVFRLHLVEFLPKNTTHFLQPLDDKYFGSFKRKLMTRVNDVSLFQTNSNTKMGNYLLSIAIEILPEMSADIILSSFRDVGPVPWCPY